MTAAVLNGKGAGEPQPIAATRPVSPLLADCAGPLGFAVKTYIAGMLALYLSFWLGLDDPRWALLTAYIVSQPDSGMVLAKSFYRMLGTVAGLLVSVTLVFTVAQDGTLFLGATALWIGLCNIASRATRGFASYGFLLAGYSVSVVGLPAALNPHGAYPLLLARFTEIALGIACAALMSRLAFSHELAPRLTALTKSLAARVDAFAVASLDTVVKPGALAAQWGALAKDIGAHESLRASAFFESADARLRTEQAGRVRDCALALCTRAAQAAVHLGSRIALPCPEPSRTDETSLVAHVRELHRVEIADARRELADALLAFENGAPTKSSAPPYAASIEPMQATLAGMRTAIAVAVTAGFWIVTAWSSGPAAVVLAAVVCSLLAPLEQPVKLTLAVAVTLILAAIPSYVTLFYLMPIAVDFPSMAVALAPILLVAGLILAQPGIGSLGLLTVVYFVTTANLDNVMSYDASSFLNSSLADLLGVGVALVLFAIFFPDSPTSTVQRFRRRLRRVLVEMVDRRTVTAHSIGQSLLEPLAGTLAHLKNDPSQIDVCFNGAIATLSFGDALDRARVVMAQHGAVSDISAILAPLLDRLSAQMPLLSRAAIIQCAWEARTACRIAITQQRAKGGGQDSPSFVAVAVACEMLRAALLRIYPLISAQAHVR